MSGLRLVDNVYCVETDCPAITCCTICPAFLCPAHSDVFTTCTANEDQLHHITCQAECIDCTAAGAQAEAEERHERLLREGT